MACALFDSDIRTKFVENLDGVQVQPINEIVGNGLVATKSLKKGDIIFEEKPLISCQFPWNAAYGYLACDNCMRPLETAEENVKRLTQNPLLSLPFGELAQPKINHVKCPFCKVLYCCSECCNQAFNQYHKTLCTHSSTRDTNHPLIVLEEAWKHIHYPPETSSIMLICRILATMKQSSDVDSTVNLLRRFCHRTKTHDEEIVHKMLGKEFQVQLDMLRQMTATAFPDLSLSQWLTPDGFVSLFAMVGTNGQGIGTSALSSWTRACDDAEAGRTVESQESLDKFIDDLYERIDEVSGSFLNNEGSGLYILQSCCNHSCSPNASPTFPQNDFTLVMRCLEDIEAGQEIRISYLDECTLERCRHSRQKILRENYLFNCQCSKCFSECDEPDVTSEEEMDEDEIGDL